MPVLLDLCSGLGGWSEAFVQDESWKVIRIDNSELVKHVPFTLAHDVNEWLDWVDGIPQPDLIVASPPCLEFSLAYSSPKSKAGREGRPFEADMTIVESCMDIIRHFNPQWWCLENVIGSIADIGPILGAPKQIHGPFVMWGTIPHLVDVDLPAGEKASKDVHSGNPLRANLKAMIPFEISFSLLRTWREQRSLLEWNG